MWRSGILVMSLAMAAAACGGAPGADDTPARPETTVQTVTSAPRPTSTAAGGRVAD